MIDNTEVVTHNGKCRETGNAGHTRQKKPKAKTKKPNTMCVVQHYPQARPNNVNKIWVLLQTTGGKEEPTIVCMRKSQHGTPNVKTHNRRTQHTKTMSNMDLNDR